MIATKARPTAERQGTADAAYLSIRGLKKIYPRTTRPAVDSVDLDVTQGELVALLGPSGCGKTTTLRMVAGLLPPSAGHIMVNGRDVVSMPVHKRGMGMVFQSYALFPHMTVAENVAFGLQMKKVPRAKTPALVVAALEMVQLDHLKDTAWPCGHRLYACSGCGIRGWLLLARLPVALCVPRYQRRLLEDKA